MRVYLFSTLLILSLTGASACQREPLVEDTSVLMTVGNRELRQDEFLRAYRVFQTAYGSDLEKDPKAAKESKIRFIHQMADQLVLMAYAQDIGVAVSAEALEKAVEDIRQDYPEGMFEQMLLENAINFDDWKDALKVRLTIDQLVHQELELKIQISEEDIANYYARHGTGPMDSSSTPEGEATDPMDQILIQQLRRQKTEQAYAPWMEKLKAQYPVMIDEVVVSQIIAVDGGTDDMSGSN